MSAHARDTKEAPAQENAGHVRSPELTRPITAIAIRCERHFKTH